VIFVVWPLYERYSYSDERADLRDHFGFTREDEAAVLLGDEQISERARVFDGVCYLDADSVKKYLNDCFYANAEDGVVLYTSADEVVRAEFGKTSYVRHAEAGAAAGAVKTVETDFVCCRTEEGVSYIALDYVKNFANFSWELFTEPYRVQMYTEWGEIRTAALNRDAALRTEKSRKSAVLTDLRRGALVTIIEENGEWSLVKTADALVGFAETRRLSGSEIKTGVPVTDYAAPPYTDLVRDGKVCLVWHQVAVRDANHFIWDMMDGAYPVNVLSPTWLRVTDASGALNSIASADYVAQAHARGIEVWALVSDFEASEPFDRHELLSQSESRKTLIENLLAAAREYDLDGINLDFELVPSGDGAHFTQFVRELSVACRHAGLVFSIDDAVPRERTMHYNRTVQGEVADYVVIMGYDEHIGGLDEAGSVASIGFVEEGIRRTLEEVPARKVVNAVPFYTRIWTTKDGASDAAAVGQKTQREWIEKRGLTPEWDEETGQNYVEYEEAGAFYQIWMEDAASQKTRLDVMRSYDLGGAAAWRLGLQAPEIWDVLAGYCK
jgi:spore germination protein YaaH